MAYDQGVPTVPADIIASASNKFKNSNMLKRLATRGMREGWSEEQSRDAIREQLKLHGFQLAPLSR